MRVVADTNVLVSAFLWTGSPHRVVIAAETRRITLYTSAVLIEELAGVLSRKTFHHRLLALSATVDDLIASYLKLAHLIRPAPIPPTILADPDDDHVLACAHAADAAYIISGDVHLLALKEYHAIPIVSPATFLASIIPPRSR